jgi:transposase-like protein
MEGLFPEKLQGIVEVDETYVGGKKKGYVGREPRPKVPVISLVERGGDVRSFPVEHATAKNARKLINEHISKEATLMTDGSVIYDHLDKQGYSDHQIINHAEYEYVRGNVYTNTVEGYFSLLKRGIIGTYHHVSYAHLMRYLAEFDFRYNGRKIMDSERTLLALKGFEGKRLTYKRTGK